MMNSRTVVAVAAFLCISTPATWAQPEADFQVNTYTVGDQAYPSICRDASDNQVVVFESTGQDGDGIGIIARRYDAGGSQLGNEFQVNSSTAGNQQFPGILCHPDGNFVIVWESQDQDGDSYGVFGQRFASDASPIGTEFQVNDITVDSQAAAAVAGGTDGSFVVTWQSYGMEEDSYDVFAKRYDSSGSAIGSEFRLNELTLDSQINPDISSDGSGNFVVVWQSYLQDGDGYGVVGRRIDSSGSVMGTEFQVNSYTEYTQQMPSVASDTNGNFVVVWESYDGQDGDGYGVFGQRFDSTGSRRGTEFQVNSYTLYPQDRPSVTFQPDGVFAVVWSSYGQDGDGSGIFAQRFAADGFRDGPEFQVNTHTLGDQGTFGFLGRVVDLASDSEGTLTFVWQSTDVFDTPQDGDGFGVFGQRIPYTPEPRPCPGDCNADDKVTVDELVLGLDVALLRVALSDCMALDSNRNGEVSIDELVNGVGSAIDGCP